MQLQPYPQTQDSGLPWLEHIPKHWQIKPGLAAFRENKRRNTGMRETTVLSLSYGRIIVKPAEKRGLVPDSFETYQIVEPGDIVIRGTDLQNDVTSLRVGLVRDVGIITSAYLAFQSVGEFSGEFSYWLLHAYDLQKVLYGLGSGLRQNLAFSDFKRLPIVLPPRAEQDLIVRFLRVQDAIIARLLQVKRAMMALLNEQKSALIHRAVTRGLDTNARLKPSSLPWLGEVPEHWEVRALKTLLSNMDYGISESLSGEGKIRVLTMGHVKNGEIYPPENGSVNSVPANLILKNLDLLFNRTNSPELVGKVGLFRGTEEERISFASYLVRLRAKPENDPTWLNYLLNNKNFWAFARSQALVSLHQANLNSTRYGQMVVPVPPLTEQRSIVAYIEGETAQINTALARIGREIELIGEYRTRLMCDVVTGQWDVTRLALGLPDLPNAPAHTLEPDADETDLDDDEAPLD